MVVAVVVEVGLVVVAEEVGLVVVAAAVVVFLLLGVMVTVVLPAVAVAGLGAVVLLLADWLPLLLLLLLEMLGSTPVCEDRTPPALPL